MMKHPALLLGYCLVWAAYLVCWSSPSLANAANTPPILPTASLNPGHNSELLVISLSGEPDDIRSFILHAPHRYVVDIHPATLPAGNLNMDAGHPAVRGIRAARFTPRTVRVVLDLHHPAEFLMATRPSVEEQSTFDIILMNVAGNPDPRPLEKQTEHTVPSLPAPDPEASSTAVSQQPPDSETTILFFPQEAEPAPQKIETRSAILPQNLDLSGFLEIKAATLTDQSDANLQTSMVRNRIRMEGKWTPAMEPDHSALPQDTSDLFLLASLQSDYLWFGPENRYDDYDLELFEGYLHWSSMPWEFRLGRQRIRWGKTDEISPVDNLNPEDLREFLLPEREDRKIPNWMARVRYFSGATTLEAVAVPFFEPSRFSYLDTDWSLFRGAQKTLLSSIPAQAGITQQNRFEIDEQQPSRKVSNGDWGVRVAQAVGTIDLAASYLYAREKTPHIQAVAPQGQPAASQRSIPAPETGLLVPDQTALLTTTFERSHILGLEFETTFDQFGLRGELAYFDQKSLHTSNLLSVRKPMIQYVLGVDHLSANDWYINFQLGHQVILDYQPDILFWERNDFTLNGEVSRMFWRGKLEAVFRYFYNITDNSSLLRPYMVLRPYNNWEITLGGDVMHGDDTTALGQFRDNDQVYTTIKYYF